MLTSKRITSSQWKKDFKDLLNPRDTPSSEEAEFWNMGVSRLQVVKKHFGDKVLGSIRSSWSSSQLWMLFTHPCKNAWTLETVSQDWQTGVLPPLLYQSGLEGVFQLQEDHTHQYSLRGGGAFDLFCGTAAQLESNQSICALWS